MRVAHRHADGDDDDGADQVVPEEFDPGQEDRDAEDGGHAGNTETAFMMAVDPDLVQKERYTGPEMATAIPAPNTWSAYPFPSSVLLYKEAQGHPVFDSNKAKQFFDRMGRTSRLKSTGAAFGSAAPARTPRRTTAAFA